MILCAARWILPSWHKRRDRWRSFQLRARSAPVVVRSSSEGGALWTVATCFTAAVSLASWSCATGRTRRRGVNSPSLSTWSRSVAGSSPGPSSTPTMNSRWWCAVLRLNSTPSAQEGSCAGTRRYCFDHVPMVDPSPARELRRAGGGGRACVGGRPPTLLRRLELAAPVRESSWVHQVVRSCLCWRAGG